jgi:UDP-2,4-diacetamido-2,4,6-trideoxy-beta-L-altropyranose hydrolase
LRKTKVYFRVDGSAQIGLGHLVRCIALAQMLQTDFEIFFICLKIPDSIKLEIKNLGFKLLVIDREGDFLSTLENDTIVVLDHYGLDSNYQKNIKDRGCKLVCIDDLYDKFFYADLIINSAPNIVASAYQTQIYSQFALGLDYALLRPVFLDKARQHVSINDHIQTAFVCFGGSDIKNITQKAVNILKTDIRIKKVIVVTGASYIYLHELKKSIKNDAKFFLHHAVSSEVMADLIADAQLAIVPSSGILQEVLAMGCKVVSGMYVENQKHIFESYKALGAFESAEDFSVENLASAIDRSFEINNKPRKYIDGRSKHRLLNTFIQLLEEKSVILRKINESDLDKTFEWAANYEIRKFSFNNNPIKYDVHKTWFMNKLNDGNCYYYLGCLNNHEFGSIRFEVENEEAKISYLIDPLYQSKGLGTILLKKGLDLLTKQLHKKKITVWGEVFHENIASIKVFKKLGYTGESNPLTGIVKFRKSI